MIMFGIGWMRRSGSFIGGIAFHSIRDIVDKYFADASTNNNFNSRFKCSQYFFYQCSHLTTVSIQVRKNQLWIWGKSIVLRL